MAYNNNMNEATNSPPERIAFQSGLIRVNYKPRIQKKLVTWVLINGFQPKGPVREHHFNNLIVPNVERRVPDSAIQILRRPRIIEEPPPRVPSLELHRVGDRALVPVAPQGAPLVPVQPPVVPVQPPVRPIDSEDENIAGPSSKKKGKAKRGRKPKKSAPREPEKPVVVPVVPKKRGRKPKVVVPESTVQVVTAPKKRGRKPKVRDPVVQEVVPVVPKKRGRKPKVRLPEPAEHSDLTTNCPAKVLPKKRGRKPKVKPVEPVDEPIDYSNNRQVEEHIKKWERLSKLPVPAEKPLLTIRKPKPFVPVAPAKKLLAIEFPEKPGPALNPAPRPVEEEGFDLPADDEGLPGQEPELATKAPLDVQQEAIDLSRVGSKAPAAGEKLLAINEPAGKFADAPQLAIKAPPPRLPKLTIHKCLETEPLFMRESVLRLPLMTRIERPLRGSAMAEFDVMRDVMSIAEKIKVRPRNRRSSLPTLKQDDDDDDEDEVNKKVRKKRKYRRKSNVQKKENNIKDLVVFVPPEAKVEKLLPKIREKRKLAEQRSIEDSTNKHSDNSQDSLQEYVPKRRKKKPSSFPLVNNSFIPVPKYGSAVKRKNQFPQKTTYNNETTKNILRRCFEDPLSKNPSLFGRNVFNSILPESADKEMEDSLAKARWYKHHLKSLDANPIDKTVQRAIMGASNQVVEPIRDNVAQEPEKLVEKSQPPADVQLQKMLRMSGPETDHLYAQPQVVLRESDRCDPNSLTISLKAADKEEHESPSQMLAQNDDTSQMQIVEADVHNLGIQQQVLIEDERNHCNSSSSVLMQEENEHDYQGMVVLAPNIASMDVVDFKDFAVDLEINESVCGEAPLTMVRENREALDPTISEIKTFIESNEEDPLMKQLKSLEQESALPPSSAKILPEELPKALQDHVIDMVPMKKPEPKHSPKKHRSRSPEKLPKALQDHVIDMVPLKKPEAKHSPKKHRSRSPEKLPKALQDHVIDMVPLKKPEPKHSPKKHRLHSPKKVPRELQDHVIDVGPAVLDKVELKHSHSSKSNHHAKKLSKEVENHDSDIRSCEHLSSDSHKKTDKLFTTTHKNKSDSRAIALVEVRKSSGHDVKKNSKLERHCQQENDMSKALVPVSKKRALEGIDPNSPCEKKKKITCEKSCLSPVVNKPQIVGCVNLFPDDTVKEKKKEKKSQTPARVRQVVRSIYAPPESAVVDSKRKIRR